MVLLAPVGHALQQLVGLINDQVRALAGREDDKGNTTEPGMEQFPPGEDTAIPRAGGAAVLRA